MTSRTPSHPAEPEPPGSPLTLSGGTVARDLVCLSHLRWDFVYQRPNHLMARAARERRVYFIEEPVPTDGDPWLETHEVDGLTVVRPHVAEHLGGEERERVLADLVEGLVHREGITSPWLWYYTPM